MGIQVGIFELPAFIQKRAQEIVGNFCTNNGWPFEFSRAILARTVAGIGEHVARITASGRGHDGVIDSDVVDEYLNAVIRNNAAAAQGPQVAYQSGYGGGGQPMGYPNGVGYVGGMPAPNYGGGYGAMGSMMGGGQMPQPNSPVVSYGMSTGPAMPTAARPPTVQPPPARPPAAAAAPKESCSGMKVPAQTEAVSATIEETNMQPSYVNGDGVKTPIPGVLRIRKVLSSTGSRANVVDFQLPGPFLTEMDALQAARGIYYMRVDTENTEAYLCKVRYQRATIWQYDHTVMAAALKQTQDAIRQSQSESATKLVKAVADVTGGLVHNICSAMRDTILALVNRKCMTGRLRAYDADGNSLGCQTKLTDFSDLLDLVSEHPKFAKFAECRRRSQDFGSRVDSVIRTALNEFLAITILDPTSDKEVITLYDTVGKSGLDIGHVDAYQFRQALSVIAGGTQQKALTLDQAKQLLLTARRTSAEMTIMVVPEVLWMTSIAAMPALDVLQPLQPSQTPRHYQTSLATSLVEWAIMADEGFTGILLMFVGSSIIKLTATTTFTNALVLSTVQYPMF